jgi:muconolactone delta-isomerase
VPFRGRPAVHSFARDVTARRRAEGERLRTQRLEALGRWRRAWRTTSTTCWP